MTPSVQNVTTRSVSQLQPHTHLSRVGVSQGDVAEGEQKGPCCHTAAQPRRSQGPGISSRKCRTAGSSWGRGSDVCTRGAWELYAWCLLVETPRADARWQHPPRQMSEGAESQRLQPWSLEAWFCQQGCGAIPVWVTCSRAPPSWVAGENVGPGARPVQGTD